jgi:hypothetical protein
MTAADTSPTSQSKSSIDDDFMPELRREIQRLIDLDADPPTDEQLKKIWPPWNTLPPDMIPELKRRVLTFDKSNKYLRNTEQRAAYEKLRRKFPDLPLDRHKFSQALELAAQWSKLLNFLQKTRTCYQELVTRQWAFAEADAHAPGRIAIFRAAREIELTRPSLLKATSPNVADVALLSSRYAIYDRARETALAALEKLLYKVPGMRTGTPLPVAEVALGVPNPPDDVPRFLYIARLDALGICSPDRLKEFLRDEFPKLKQAQKLKFRRFQTKPKYGKNPYAGFLVWVLDNQPIFGNPEFGWQWKDILRAAEKKGINCPKLTELKQWGYNHKVKLGVKLGQPSNDSCIEISSQLLTPAPVFGDLLRPTPPRQK